MQKIINRKTFFLTIFIVAALLLALFLRWSQTKVTPRVEEIVQDIESNTGDLKDKVEDLVENDDTVISGAMDVGYLNNGLWGSDSMHRIIELSSPEKSTRTISDYTDMNAYTDTPFEKFIGETYTSKEDVSITMYVAHGALSKKYLSEIYKETREAIVQATGVLPALLPLFGEAGYTDEPVIAKSITYPGTDMAVMTVNLIGQAVPLMPRISIYALKGDDVILIISSLDDGDYIESLRKACAEQHQFDEMAADDTAYTKAFACYNDAMKNDSKIQDMINTEVKTMLEVFALNE